MTNHQISLHCPTTKYPCSAQPQSIPAVPNHPSIPAVPNRLVSLQSPTAKYPCSAQPPKYPCSAQPLNILAVPNRKVSLQCPTAEYQYSCSAFAVLQGRQFRGGRETLHFLCNNGFRVGMLEVYLFYPYLVLFGSLFAFFDPYLVFLMHIPFERTNRCLVI